MNESEAASPTKPGRLLAHTTTVAMAAACAVGVANIYYNQPMLGVMEQAFPHANATTLIPTATQLGYAAGLLLLVPLGDVIDRRKLIVGHFTLLGAALAAAAAAPNAPLLVLASLLVGIAATVAQQVVPFAAALAAPENRGRAVGMVMGGLLCGILLSRTLAGQVAASLGWRSMFWIAVPMNLAAALGMAAILPPDRKNSGIAYGGALASLLGLWRCQPKLRRATYLQACLFAGFSVFWTILALHLQAPPFRAGAEIAGYFGILGAAGVLAAPIAGRLADARGPHLAIGLGAALAFLSWLCFGLWNARGGLILGVILLDFGVQASLVSNQHIIYALDPAARNRINTLFMTGMFLGGAIGSAFAMVLWRHGGWGEVCGLGGCLAAGAVALSLRKPFLF